MAIWSRWSCRMSLQIAVNICIFIANTMSGMDKLSEIPTICLSHRICNTEGLVGLQMSPAINPSGQLVSPVLGSLGNADIPMAKNVEVKDNGS